ncbi:hypothetical protein EJB05_07649 [Eragrostis curvula]|uniref:Uncharacterized protein n=1 Tax=Eragrostis curvula TaxID=38414 RepID=A0A5J9WII0_9POAL|nr:hypothetical protein EJB05_07649 [Eragrostis curvula]
MDLRELHKNTTMKTIKVGSKADRKSKGVQTAKDTAQARPRIGLKAAQKCKGVQKAKDTTQARPRGMHVNRNTIEVGSKAVRKCNFQKVNDATQARPRIREFCSKRNPEKIMPDKREKAKKPEEPSNSPVIFKIKMREGNVHLAGFAEKAKRRFALSYGEN